MSLNTHLQDTGPQELKDCSAGEAGEAQQNDIDTCPICTETAEQRAVTSCGHFFCSDCLTQSLKLRSECPLCRRHLERKDVYDACTPTEAAAAAAKASGDLGTFSTKVSILRRACSELQINHSIHLSDHYFLCFPHSVCNDNLTHRSEE